ncbi:MAG: type III-B CRISPR-associated protein Cas10/Cmr2, partial [Chloroflexota bacterium]
IVLDGDSMGESVSNCLKSEYPEQAHQELSRKLINFSEAIAKHYKENVIYNGGDDVLALAPLSSAFQVAQNLAESFREITQGITASAGIAIAHHLYPLGATLQAARQAEQHAKQLDGKAAVCVQVLKRSGEITRMRSSWLAVGSTLAEIVHLFKGDEQGQPLSARFAYDVGHSAYSLPEADEKFEAELKRLIKRHRNSKHPLAPDSTKWAERLRMWAASLPDQSTELGYWLALARFMAQGGEG